MDKRRMCPNCRAFITTDDKVCPYCEAKVGPRAIERREPGTVAGIIPGAQFTTSIILLVNIGLFVVTAIYSGKSEGGISGIDGRTLLIFGAKAPGILFDYHEWWRLVTAGFLHGGLLHILMNSWALYSIGGQVEELYGTARFIVFYFISTVMGFAVSSLFSRSVSVGASAAIMGLIGVMIAYGLHHRTATGAAVRSAYTQWAVYGLVMGFMPGIDNAAHIGGLAGGFLASYATGVPKLYESWRDTVWKVAAGICLVLIAFSFFTMFSLVQAVLRPS